MAIFSRHADETSDYGARIGWENAPSSLFRSLPGHAMRARVIDELLADTDYVLHGDLRRLIPATDHTHTPAGVQPDRTVRIWDPATGAPERTLEGHPDWVNAVCAVRVADRELLASASDDRTVHLWDLATGQALHLIPVHHAAYGLAWCNDDDLVVALSAGLLTVNFTACERLVSTPNGPSPSVLASITADYRLNVVALPLSCKGRR